MTLSTAFDSNRWKQGDLHFLLATILHNPKYHIAGAGFLCYIQNGVHGQVAYYGATCPKWLILCHCHVDLSTLSFVTIQWTSYDRGFQLPLAAVPFVYIKQPHNEIDLARDALALSFATHDSGWPCPQQSCTHPAGWLSWTPVLPANLHKMMAKLAPVAVLGLCSYPSHDYVMNLSGIPEILYLP